MCLRRLSGMVFTILTFGFLLVPILSSGQTLDPPPGEKGPITCCQADSEGCTDRSGGYWETDRTYYNVTSCP